MEADLLQEQYEQFPYPPRNPKDERHRLLKTSLDGMASIQHYVFGGSLAANRRFRVLVAGGGTGDSLVYLAQQASDLAIAVDIVYLDISGSARGIAEARIRTRGLGNVTFVTGTIDELDQLGLGEFDYINCSGVLHHMKDPMSGLLALVRSLSPTGGIGLMLYGTLGRTGVDPVREMLEVVAPAGLGLTERARIARRLLAVLPTSNWLRKNGFIDDYNRGEADLVDLLLNARETSYSVSQIAGMVSAAKLRLISFIPSAWYEPSSFVTDAEILAGIVKLGMLERAAFTEYLVGGPNKHIFYAVKETNDVSVPPLDPFVVPILNSMPETYADTNGDRASVKIKSAYFDGQVQMPTLCAKLLTLADGVRTIREISTELGVASGQLIDEFKSTYRFLNGFGLIHLSRGPR